MHRDAVRFLTTYLTGRHCRFVIEFGSYNVNGTARQYVRADRWHGIDLRSGPGVDEVADAATWRRPSNMPPADTVICMECLEHTPHPLAICRSAYEALAPNGLFIVTTAGVGRAPHACDGQPTVPPGEYYHAIPRDALRAWLYEVGFTEVGVIASDTEQIDIYAAARRA